MSSPWITHRAASDDRDFAGKTATLTVTVTDNDTGNILPSATTTIEVIEGDDTGTTYDVRLSHQPSAAVTVPSPTTPAWPPQHGPL